MKPYLKSLLFLLVVCLSSCSNQQSLPFTDWMPRAKFAEFLKEKESKDDQGKNFWDKGHWIDAVECKWEGGYQQYRIAYSPTPKDKAHWWFWYFDMDADFFEKRLTEHSVQGFQLVHYNKSENPNGKEIFAAVWHKIR